MQEKEAYQDVEKFIGLIRTRKYPEIYHAFSELELKFLEKGINRCKLAAKKSVGASAICPSCEQVYYKDYENQVFCCPKCRLAFARNISRFKTKMRVNACLDIHNPDYDQEERQEDAQYMREGIENPPEESFRQSSGYYFARAVRKNSKGSKKPSVY